MLIRRRAVLGAAVAGLAGPAITACSGGDSAAVAAGVSRRTFAPTVGDERSVVHELVRYATLAPSSHNTQCWKFRAGADSITIEPDFARRCPVVDPDDHHLFVSLGCATENLVQASLANGFQGTSRFDPSGDGSVRIALAPTRLLRSPLFDAIPSRQSTRGDYDGSKLSSDELKALDIAGTGDGVRVMLLTDIRVMERLLALVISGNTVQLNDAAFVAELKGWVRFSGADAVRAGDGLYAGASGNPVLPRWLGSPLMGIFMTPKSENDRYARQVRNSAGIAVFVSAANDKAHWVEAGRSYERFALQCTALGIRNAFLNQAVEVPSIRTQLGTLLGLTDERPDLIVRFGKGPSLPLSLRRPVQAVLV